MDDMHEFMHDGRNFSACIDLLTSDVSSDVGWYVIVGEGSQSSGWVIADGQPGRDTKTRFQFVCLGVEPDRIHYKVTVAEGPFTGASVIVDEEGYLAVSHTQTPHFLKVEIYPVDLSDQVWFFLRDHLGHKVHEEAFWEPSIILNARLYSRLGVGLADAQPATFRLSGVQRDG